MATPKSSSKKVTATKKATKKATKFPAGRCRSMLRRGRYSKRVGGDAGLYMAAVLEYLTSELLELAVKARKSTSSRVTPRDICQAVRNDEELGGLLKDVTLSRGGVVPNVHKVLEKKSKKSKK